MQMALSANSKHAEFVLAALDQLERPLTQYAARLLKGDLSAARDVVQHAFLKLCEQDQSSIGNRVAPWLYTVCRNRAIDLIRGRNSEKQLESDDFRLSQNGKYPENDPATIVEDADFFSRLQSLIDKLPDSQREVVDLWARGFTSSEMARITGRNDGAIRIALHRAIKQLRNHESVRRWLGEDAYSPVPIPSPLSNRYRGQH